MPIRLSSERWKHIVENHNDLAGYYDQVLATVEKPDLIVQGYRGALIALKGVAKGRYLAVVYKELSPKDGFILSAYFTRRPDKSKKVWPK